MSESRASIVTVIMAGPPSRRSHRKGLVGSLRHLSLGFLRDGLYLLLRSSGSSCFPVRLSSLGFGSIQGISILLRLYRWFRFLMDFRSDRSDSGCGLVKSLVGFRIPDIRVLILLPCSLRG